MEKLDAVADIRDANTPRVTWEAENEESLGVCGTAVLEYAVAAETREALPQQGGRPDLAPENCSLTSPHSPWHICVRARTHSAYI